MFATTRALVGLPAILWSLTAPVQVAPSPPSPRLAPSVRAVPVTEKVVAFTFDDGPNPRYTPSILRLLRENGARATFFVVGREAQRFPHLVQEEQKAGMEVALHGMHHLVLSGRTPQEVEEEVRAGEDLLRSILGHRPYLYRLPQGKGDDTAREVLGRMGYLVVYWSVDPRDYLGIPASKMTTLVMRQVAPGKIVIFHDGGGRRSETVQAVAQLLPALRQEGYTVTTVGDLLRRAGYPWPPSPSRPKAA